MSNSPRILFVDDEELVLKAVYRDFLDEDYEILTAISGRDGLDLLEECPVEVVVSDFRMPQMNGGEFLKLVSEKWPDTVRIVLSGYADISSVILAINEGAIFKFVSKPWQGDELRETVAEALTKYNEMTQLRALAEQALGATQELFDDANVTSREIHERNMQLEETVQHLEIYRTVFNLVAVPLVIFDSEGLLSDANPAAMRILAEIAGASGHAVVPEAMLDDVAAFLAKHPVTSKAYNGSVEDLSIYAALSSVRLSTGTHGVLAVLTRGKSD